MPRGQQSDDFLAVVRIAENSVEKPVELIFQPRILAKQQFVGVALKTQAFLEIAEIIRYAAKHHVGLNDVIARHFNSLMGEIFLTFLQRERRQLDFISEPPVQSATVARKIAKNP